MFNISTKICNVIIDPCIMNSSGPLCTTFEELKNIANSQAGAIVTKTCTKEPREGNPEPRIYEFGAGTINSIGWANLGCKKHGELIKKLKDYKKPIIASVGGFSVNEYVGVSKELAKCGANMLEVNLSCPNLPNFRPPAYVPEFAEKILNTIKKSVKIPISVKLPPYLDENLQIKMARVIKRSKVDCLTCVNSAGNTILIDANKEKICIKPKWGGLTGSYIKPLALGNIRRYYEFFNGKLPIIGVGGVWSGKDIFEHLLAGACAVQVGSAYLKEGAAVFQRLKEELTQIIKAKGYSNINKIIGELQEMG